MLLFKNDRRETETEINESSFAYIIALPGITVSLKTCTINGWMPDRLSQMWNKIFILTLRLMPYSVALLTPFLSLHTAISLSLCKLIASACGCDYQVNLP